MSLLSALLRNGDDFARHFGSHADEMSTFMRAGRNTDDIVNALRGVDGAKSLDDILADLPADLQSKARFYFRPLYENLETITRMEDFIRAADNVDLDKLGRELGKSPDELAQMLGKTTDELTTMLRSFQDEIAETASRTGARNAASDRLRAALNQGDEAGDTAARNADEGGDAAAKQTDEAGETIARETAETPGRTSRFSGILTRRRVIGGAIAGTTLYLVGSFILQDEFAPSVEELTDDEQFDNNYTEAQAAVPAAIRWINQNKQEINATINNLQGISDEVRQSMLIRADIPANASITDPAFLRAYASVSHVSLPEDAARIFEPLNRVKPALQVYLDLYDAFGDDAQLPDDPRQAMSMLNRFALPIAIKQLDKQSIYGDLPDFELTQNLNLQDPAFLASYTAARGHAMQQADAIVQRVLNDDSVDAQIRTRLREAMSAAPHVRLEVLLQPGVLNQQDYLKVAGAHAILAAESGLDQATLATLSTALTQANPTQTQGNSPEETGMSLEEIRSLYTQEIRDATFIVERAFDNRQDYDPEAADWKPDQFLDHNTRHELDEMVTTAFARYGNDFRGDNISRVIVQTDPQSGEEKYFAFNEHGYIFEVQIEGGSVVKDHAYATDTDFPVTGRLDDGAKATIVGEAIGRIDQGLHVRDENGAISSVHPASAAFMGWVFESMAQEERERNARIDGFFEAIPDSQTPSLEEELRLALANRNLTEQQFKQSDLYRRIKEARGDDDSTNEFVTQLFAMDLNRFSHGADTLGLVESVGESSAVYNLLRVLSGSRVNEAHQALRDQVPWDRDNILSRNGYEIMKQVRGGERIALSVLEDPRQDEGGARQRAALHKEFGRLNENGELVLPQSVTREEVYAFVQKQFDLRAITTLGDLRLEQTYLNSMSAEDQEKFGDKLGEELTEEMVAAMSREAQGQLIENNMDILDRVSMAMAEGRFNPDDRDVHLVFKAFERPSLDDPVIRDLINNQRAAGRVPTGQYALNYMTENELVDITGIADFNDPSVYTTAQKVEILDELFRSPPANLITNDNYRRLVMNFYEPFMANYTWFRNGAVDSESPNDWNGRYGEPGQDELMHMFMTYNQLHLDEQFPGAHRVFFKGGVNSIDYSLTYDEVRARLAEVDAAEGTNHVARLDQGIEALNNPSMYMYLMDLRLHHYREMRNNHYIPGLRDRQIVSEFNRVINNDQDGSPSTDPNGNGPETPDPSNTVVSTEPQGEVEQDTQFSNLGTIPSAVMVASRYRPAQGLSTSTELATVRGTGTDLIVRPGTEVMVIPPNLTDPRAQRDVARAWHALKLAEGSTESGEIANARRLVNSIKERYNLTDTQIRTYGEQFDADIRAQRRANTANTSATPTNGDGATIKSTTTGDIRTTGTEIVPYDNNRSLIVSEGASATTTALPENRSLVLSEPGRNLPVLYEGHTMDPRASFSGGRFISGGAGALSIGLAFTDRDESWTIAPRLGAATIDVGLAADDIAMNSRLFGSSAKRLIGSGGVAIVATTGVEVGINLANKDGQGAGAAATVGTFALGGMGTGAALTVWLGPGAAVGAGVGAIVGTLAGVTAVAYTGVENWAGRQFNDIVYNGSWFNDGMIVETERLLQKTAQYKQALETGTLSQTEMAEYHEHLRTLEDHLIDLQNAEVGLANLALGSWHEVDTNHDGNMTEAEMNAGDSADHKNIQFWVTNRQLQEQLASARDEMNTAYDNARHGQLDDLLNGARSANDVEARLKGEFAHVARNIDDTWQVNGWWNNQDDWERDLDTVRNRIQFGQGENAILQIDHLTHEEVRELQREVYNIRSEVEDRIQNLLYEANRGRLSANGFHELQNLRDNLRTADTLETALWSQRGPLGDRAFGKQSTFDLTRARDALNQFKGNDGRIDRNGLRTFLNRAENANIVVGRESLSEDWAFWRDSAEELATKTRKLDMTDRQLDNMDEETLTDKFEDLQEIEEDLHNKVYNLMLQASEGTLSREDARELDRALTAYEQLQNVKSEYEQQFRENSGDITGQGGQGHSPTNNPAITPGMGTAR